MGRTLLWRLPDPKPREFAGNNFEFVPVALSPDGKTIVAPPEADSPFEVWDAASGQSRFQLEESKGVADLAVFSPDGRWFITASRDDRIRLYKSGSSFPWRTIEAHKAGTYATAFTPNGRLLVSAGRDSVIALREMETGTVRRKLTGHRGAILALAVSPDGRLLASAGEDGQVLLHSLVSPRKTDKAWDDDLLWLTLANRDAAEAEKAMALLFGSPREAITLLASRLKPTPSLSSSQTERWIGELEHRRYPVRTEAAKELERLGPSALSFLRQALEQKPSLELRRRLEDLMKRIEECPLSPENLRAVRAIEVLEQFGTREARTILRELATGATGSHATEAARSALRRWSD